VYGGVCAACEDTFCVRKPLHTHDILRAWTRGLDFREDEYYGLN